MLHRTGLLLLGLAFLMGCTPGDSGNSPPQWPGLLENQRIDVLGEQRNYHLYLPTDPATASIVLLLHGNGGSSDQLLGLSGTVAPYQVWLEIALRENLILLVPDGAIGSEGKQGWNDCRTDAPTNPNTDDVQFLSDLLDRTVMSYSTGVPRVFALGTSNGAHMVMRLAEEIPDDLDGIAILVASRPVNTECSASSSPLSVLIMNGTDDPILPYGGGQIASSRGAVSSTPQTVDYWVNRNQTDVTPVTTLIPDRDPADGSSVQRFSYRNGIGGTVVEHYEVVNGGHTEPSLVERYGAIFRLIVGSQNGDLEMAEEVWGFFNSL